jgi:hypothetical protein
MLDFVAYMRGKGHRYTWLHHGQVARPIGLFALKFHCNDNQRDKTRKPTDTGSVT